MKVIGLTGSIGMGKSTTAAMFREAGIPVYDADAAVHDLYDEGGADMVVLDVPLLFETGGHANVHAVVVVSAPPEMQRERVLARPGMTPERLDAILEQQLADAEKRARAHYVVDTGRGLEAAREQVTAIIADLRKNAD